MGTVKTTLDLPDELMRAIKVRAAREDRKLKDLIAELLRQGLTTETRPAGPAARRVKLPLVRCAHPAKPDDEMTPDRVSEVLIAEEAEARGAAVQ
jgi:plasmid stability protein